MLKQLQNDPQIDEIWIMPDKIPPHKECDYLPLDSDRIKMCEIVAKDFSKASLCLIEFDREGKSYTYDTVVNLKGKFPQKEFVFVCGGDMFVYFPKWYRYEELMKLLPFYVFTRTDTKAEDFNASLLEFRNMGMEIIVNNTPIPDISSTAFRTTKLPDLLPQKVYDYIKERGIYNV
jgi:nicotinate-nucleotide adenylyltransferase